MRAAFGDEHKLAVDKQLRLNNPLRRTDAQGENLVNKEIGHLSGTNSSET